LFIFNPLKSRPVVRPVRAFPTGIPIRERNPRLPTVKPNEYPEYIPPRSPTIAPILGPPKIAATNVAMCEKSNAAPPPPGEVAANIGATLIEIPARMFPKALIIAMKAICFEFKKTIVLTTRFYKVNH